MAATISNPFGWPATIFEIVDARAGFRALIGAIRGTDVALANLELTLHDFEGYAQADSGGMHLAARPRIAHELAWAGIDMVSGANNHPFEGRCNGTHWRPSQARGGGLLPCNGARSSFRRL